MNAAEVVAVVTLILLGLVSLIAKNVIQGIRKAVNRLDTRVTRQDQRTNTLVHGIEVRLSKLEKHRQREE